MPPSWGRHPFCHVDSTESRSLKFRICSYHTSIARASCSHAKGTVVLCVLRQTDSHSLVLQKCCANSHSRQQCGTVLISAPDTLDGHASLDPVPVRPANITHMPQTQVASEHGSVLLSTKGDGKGRSIPEPFLLYLACSRQMVYITQGPRGKCQNRIELGGYASSQAGKVSCSWGISGG